MKKILSVLLVMAMAVGMAACSTPAESQSSSESSSSQAAESSSEAEESSSEESSEAEAVYEGANELSLYLAGFQNQDPQIWTWGTHVDRMGIFQGLVIFDQEMNVVMADAESLTPNEDATVWTVKLREDLMWSDGTPLNAHDYLYSFERIMTPDALTGQTAAFFGDVPFVNVTEVRAGELPFSEIGIKAIDDYTIEFTMSLSYPTLDIRLTESWGLPVPQHVIEEFNEDWSKPENIVSNGPFVVEAREGDVHLTLAKNENYAGEVSLDAVHIYTGTQNQVLAYQNGDINVANVTAGDMEAISNDPELSEALRMDDTSIVTYIGFLQSSNDVLQMNPKIRQAISMSIDREIISRDVNKDLLSPAQSMVFPLFADWAEEVTLAGTTANVDEAQKLMEEAGFPNGEGLEPMTCLIAGEATATTLAIVDMIETGTGIEINIVNQEWAAYVEQRDMYHDNDGVYGFFIDGWGTSTANAAGSFSNLQFDMRLSNLSADAQKQYVAAKEAGSTVPERDELLTELTTYQAALDYDTKYNELQLVTDEAAISEGYKELEMMRQEDAGFIPLYWNKSVKLVNPALKGYSSNPLLLGAPQYFNTMYIEG